MTETVPMDVTKPTESDHLLLPSLLPVDVQSDLLQEEEENTKTSLSDSNSADTNNTSEAGTETVTNTEPQFEVCHPPWSLWEW